MRDTKRLEHFLILRLVIALAGFLLVQLWRESLEVAPSAALSTFVYVVLCLYFLEAIGALALVRFVSRVRGFIAFQVGIDLVTVGLMVASTGGLGSIFCPLFFASVLAASTVIGLEGSIVCSSVATVVLAIASIVPHMMADGEPGSNEVNHWRMASFLFTYGVALHGVSFLSSRLVGGLTEARNLTEEIVETMGEGLIAADGSGRILLVNGEARKLLCLSPRGRFDGKSIDDVLTREEHALVRRSVTLQAESHGESSLLRPDGKRFPVEVKTSVLRGRKGNVRGTVLLLRDRTLKRQVDAAARRIAKLEELTELARGIAHEVRNPLASMCGCAQEIAREPGITGQTQRLAEILVREAKRVDGIIDEFLNFARIRKLKRTQIVVGELLACAGVLLEARIKDSPRQRIVVETADEPVTISGDNDLLIQILLNIGINALEALGAGGGEVRLSAERKLPPFCQSPGWNAKIEMGVEIVVADTGCGVKEGELTKIFNPFYSQKARGSGLGLTIAHRIVRIHGGTISAASTPGEGSVFRVWLPGAGVAETTGAPREVSCT